ncbi:hypothetical protein ABKY47_002573 [Aeromonas hydrophila]
MKGRLEMSLITLVGLVLLSSLLPAWAGDNIASDIRLTVTALPKCNADTDRLTFDLGEVATSKREIAQTQVVNLRCDAKAKVTLMGSLQRGGTAQARGAVPSLFGCETAGQQQCFDLTQAGHTFDVPAAGADVGIKVVYLAPTGLGTDTFTGQLTVTWP